MNRRTYSALRLRHAAWPLLALVAVAALAVSPHPGWGQTKQTPGPSALEGTWTGTLTVTAVMGPQPPPGLPPPFQVLSTFTSNGGSISTSSGGPGVGQGTWVQTGDRTFSTTDVTFSFDSKGQFTGMQKSRETLTVNATFDAWTGFGKDDFFDAAGKLQFTGTATVQGTRLRVEPVQ